MADKATPLRGGDGPKKPGGKQRAAPTGEATVTRIFPKDPDLRRPPPRTIAVAGGKGGVGKTAVALGLAKVYASDGLRVLLVDGDLGMADLNLALELAPTWSMLDVLHGAPIKEVLIEAHGIWLLPALNASFALANIDSQARSLLFERIEELESDFDIMIIDTASGIYEGAIQFVAAAAEIVLVVTPEPLALADNYATLKALSTRYGVKNAFLLPNMTRSPAEAHELLTRMNALTVHFLGMTLTELPFIPYDALVPISVAAGVPLIDHSSNSPAARAFERLPRSIAELQHGPCERTVLWKK